MRSLSGASDQDEISGIGIWYCLHGDGPVERGKSAVIPNGETKQIGIGDLLVSADHRGLKLRQNSDAHASSLTSFTTRRSGFEARAFGTKS